MIDNINSVAGNLGSIFEMATDETAKYKTYLSDRIALLNRQLDQIQASEYIIKYKRTRREWHNNY